MIRGKTLSRLTPYLFLVVPLIIYLIWVIGPMFYTFYLSLTDWDGLSAPNFTGLRNYQKLFKDPVFYISLKNNLKWVLSFITIPVVAGLALAMALNRAIPLAKLFKASALRLTGLGALAQGWLSDKKLVMWAIIAAGIWRQVGYVMVLYLAGLQGIDPSLVDASKVDGCTGWQTFRHIIFPLLMPVTVIVVVISIVDSLRSFDLVSVMTRGGPYNSSSVLANFMYIEAFNNYKMGYGAAIAVILFLISLVFIFTYLWRVLQTEMEY